MAGDELKRAWIGIEPCEVAAVNGAAPQGSLTDLEASVPFLTLTMDFMS